LRPVDYKWNYREDYVDENDGSKTRNRYHHGLIAQEVEAVIQETTIDFGGLQHHSINGGKDVYSLAYDEFIGPLIKSIQELSNETQMLKIIVKNNFEELTTKINSILENP
jgi:hypothetical protein